MTIVRARLGLPLFARELREQANRRRTYVLRTIYACLLFGTAYFQFEEILAFGTGFEILGRGSEMFQTLVGLQFVGILLFMPALAASAIAHEKERNTLPLLLVTRLGPLAIIFEKLLARLMPMVGFLLLAMPLSAFAYSLGGVSAVQLWGHTWLLLLFAVTVASLTLMCSTFCATTTGAFAVSYVLTIATVLMSSCCVLPFSLSSGAGSGEAIGFLVMSTVVLLFLTGLFLANARSTLISQAFSAPTSRAAERPLRHRDRFKVSLNESTNDVTVTREIHSLPGDEPVAWRETSASSFGIHPTVVVLLVAIEIPLVLMVAAGITSDSRDFLVFLLALLFIPALLVIVARTTALVSRERDRGTLDLLLTTPMTGAEILRQKMHGIGHLLAYILIPFATLIGLQGLLTLIRFPERFTVEAGLHLLCMTLSVAVYLPLTAWLALLISLAVRSRLRAILLSTVIICGWTFLPLQGIGPQRLISPLEIVILSERGRAGLPVILGNFLVYGLLTYALRGWCLYWADAFLGRLGTNERSLIDGRWRGRQPESAAERDATGDAGSGRSGMRADMGTKQR